jgi:hypothetical protein
MLGRVCDLAKSGHSRVPSHGRAWIVASLGGGEKEGREGCGCGLEKPQGWGFRAGGSGMGFPWLYRRSNRG